MKNRRALAGRSAAEGPRVDHEEHEHDELADADRAFLSFLAAAVLEEWFDQVEAGTNAKERKKSGDGK